MTSLLLLLLQQLSLPAPRGYVNDFAGVLDPADVAHLTAVITDYLRRYISTPPRRRPED